MTPNKLPPLPELVRIGGLMSNVAYNLAQSADLPQHARDSLDDLRRQWDEALRQSQSLPAGAVADGPVFYVGRVYDCDAGEDRGEIHPTLPANLIGKRVRLVPVEQALQADAREKGEALYNVPAAQALCAAIGPGYRVIYRDAFRWKDEAGSVMSNHYDGQNAPYLCEEHGHELVLDLGFAAILKDKRLATQPAQASEATLAKAVDNWLNWFRRGDKKDALEAYGKLASAYATYIATSSQETASE